MSEYCDVKTEFRNEGALVCALLEMGKWAPEMIERHAEGAHLFGVSGDRREQRAHVIIRRQHVGRLANDLGFQRDANGMYVAHVSEWERSHGYNDDWMKQVKQHYVYHVMRMQQEARGRRVTRQWLAGGRPGTRKQLITVEGYR
jgi:hypothetical protein